MTILLCNHTYSSVDTHTRQLSLLVTNVQLELYRAHTLHVLCICPYAVYYSVYATLAYAQ